MGSHLRRKNKVGWRRFGKLAFLGNPVEMLLKMFGSLSSLVQTENTKSLFFETLNCGALKTQSLQENLIAPLFLCAILFLQRFRTYSAF
jgi:hypothetical protein